MRPMINVKICDMSPYCDGISNCPTGALYWDNGKKVIAHDESKCIGCGNCANACPMAHAIKFARTAEEEKQIQAEYDADPRKVEDLFIDRYGCDIVLTQKTISADALQVASKMPGLTILELNNEGLIRCLLMSIPMKELFGPREKWTHVKVHNPSEELLHAVKVEELPALVFFRDGIEIGKVEGYFEDNVGERGLLEKKIREILGS